jgi:hypothetical protein
MVDAKISKLSWESAANILTVKEATAFLRVSTDAVYAAIRLGLLAAANFGKCQTRIANHVLREELAKKGESPQHSS